MSVTPLMTVREAAVALGYTSRDPVYGLVKRGELRAHKISGHIRISQEAIDELLASTEIQREPTEEPVLAKSAPARRRARRERAPSAPWETRRAKGAR